MNRAAVSTENKTHSDIDESDDLVSNIDTDRRNEAIEPPSKLRKVLTSKRLVKSLDACLNTANYSLFNSLGDTEKFVCTLNKKTKNAPAKTISWTNEKPTNTGRQGRENIIKTKCAPINNSNLANTNLEAWQLFMTDEMLEHITRCTNIQIDEVLSKLQQKSIENYRSTIKNISIR